MSQSVVVLGCKFLCDRQPPGSRRWICIKRELKRERGAGPTSVILLPCEIVDSVRLGFNSEAVHFMNPSAMPVFFLRNILYQLCRRRAPFIPEIAQRLGENVLSRMRWANFYGALFLGLLVSLKESPCE